MTDFNMDFYKGKKVLVTGHNGFKGSWMCRMLIGAGAEVTGYSTEPPTQPNLFSLSDLAPHMNSVMGDVRDLQHMLEVFDRVKPEIVIHMAAQPIVRDSYKEPVYTYETNVMGTVHVLECVRQCASVKSFVNVTTDKVYLNREWNWGYRENEELNGYDPYSNSKSCSELVTGCYRNSFFNPQDNAARRVAISMAKCLSMSSARGMSGGTRLHGSWRCILRMPAITCPGLTTAPCRSGGACGRGNWAG